MTDKFFNIDLKGVYMFYYSPFNNVGVFEGKVQSCSEIQFFLTDHQLEEVVKISEEACKAYVLPKGKSLDYASLSNKGIVQDYEGQPEFAERGHPHMLKGKIGMKDKTGAYKPIYVKFAYSVKHTVEKDGKTYLISRPAECTVTNWQTSDTDPRRQNVEFVSKQDGKEVLLTNESIFYRGELVDVTLRVVAGIYSGNKYVSFYIDRMLARGKGDKIVRKDYKAFDEYEELVEEITDEVSF